MKIFQLLLVSLIIYFCYSTTVCDIDDSATSQKDCKDRELAEGDKYCCYFEGSVEGHAYKACLSLSEADYKDINKYIENFEKADNTGIDKIDCKSFYLQLGIMSLIFLLL